MRHVDDNGGVHINSGIPNRAFYLLATASAGTRGSAPGHIWYDALRSPLLTPTATFRQFARITHRAARQRYGARLATRRRPSARHGPTWASAGNEDRGPHPGRVRGQRAPPGAGGRDRGPRARRRARARDARGGPARRRPAGPRGGPHALRRARRRRQRAPHGLVLRAERAAAGARAATPGPRGRPARVAPPAPPRPSRSAGRPR